jgi:hypothetical protein
LKMKSICKTDKLLDLEKTHKQWQLVDFNLVLRWTIGKGQWFSELNFVVLRDVLIRKLATFTSCVVSVLHEVSHRLEAPDAAHVNHCTDERVTICI